MRRLYLGVSCSVPSCDNPAIAKGLCTLHYSRKQRGTPLDNPIKGKCKGLTCSIAGCSSPVDARGMCNLHYLRWWEGRELDTPKIIRRRNKMATFCIVVGCFEPSVSNDLCSMHCQREKAGLPLTSDRIRDKHGKSHTREYGIWEGIKQRCLNPKDLEYMNYGGRGITLDYRWMRFSNFYSDMGESPTPKHTIERVDVNKGYGPANCEWATMLQQGYNKRTSVIITAFGVTGCIAEVSRQFNILPNTMQGRLKRGYTAEGAILLG